MNKQENENQEKVTKYVIIDHKLEQELIQICDVALKHAGIQCFNAVKAIATAIQEGAPWPESSKQYAHEF